MTENISSRECHSYLHTIQLSIVSIFTAFLILTLHLDYSTTSTSLWSFNSLKSQYADFLNSKDLPHSYHLYQSLCVTPYIWNVFHLAAIEHNNTIFNPNFAYSAFRVSSLLDLSNKTPLHYLTTQQTLDHPCINFMIQYIVDYIQDKDARSEYEVEQLHLSLSSLFKFIIDKANPKIKDQYLDLCCSPFTTSEPLPQFGQANSRNTFSTTLSVGSSVYKDLYKPGEEKISFSTTMVHQEYSVTSENMFQIVLILTSIENEDTFRTKMVVKLLDHIWENVQLVIITSGIYYSTVMVVFSVYIAMAERNVPLEAVIIVLSGILLAAECLQVYYLRRRYLSNIFNIVDLVTPILTITFIASRLSDNENFLAQEWISSIAIMLGYLRWVSYLRFFKSISKLFFIFFFSSSSFFFFLLF